nr:ABC transporter ATP-binding protein [Pseudobacteriovorax antillogorgiicola]
MILRVQDLVTSFQTESGKLTALDGVSFEVRKGRTLGVVGESGSGKSVTSLSIMGLLPKPAGRIERGVVEFHGKDLTKLSLAEMYRVRGNQVSMIFQEPMTALNPVKKVGRQLQEVFDLHFPSLNPKEAQERVVALLDKVGIPSPEQRAKEYPHQLSGGMRQRAMIAMALACEPEILIADEPTTALDVTIQAQILDLMKDLQESQGMSVIFITHDLGVIAEVCDDVIVMYGGQVLESAPVDRLFEKPHHPYTQGLLASIPRLEQVRKTQLKTIEGMVPSLQNMPQGCRFENRCPFAIPRCKEESPVFEQVSGDHQVRCFRWQEIEEGKSE